MELEQDMGGGGGGRLVHSGVFAESTDEHSMPAPTLGYHFRIKYLRAASMLLLFYMSRY